MHKEEKTQMGKEGKVCLLSISVNILTTRVFLQDTYLIPGHAPVSRQDLVCTESSQDMLQSEDKCELNLKMHFQLVSRFTRHLSLLRESPLSKYC